MNRHIGDKLFTLRIREKRRERANTLHKRRNILRFLFHIITAFNYVLLQSYIIVLKQAKVFLQETCYTTYFPCMTLSKSPFGSKNETKGLLSRKKNANFDTHSKLVRKMVIKLKY